MQNLKVANIEVSYRRFLSDFSTGIIAYFYLFLFFSKKPEIFPTVEFFFNVILNLPLSLQIVFLFLSIPLGTTINAISWLVLEKLSDFIGLGILFYYFPIIEGTEKRYCMIVRNEIGIKLCEIKNFIKRYQVTSYLDNVLDSFFEYTNKKRNEFARGLRILFRNLSFLNFFIAMKDLNLWYFFFGFIFLFISSAIKVFIFVDRINTFVIWLWYENDNKTKKIFLEKLRYYLRKITKL